ncbi:MAG: GNAT family N-acetyltransferase [Pseudomonadota bacterium]
MTDAPINIRPARDTDGDGIAAVIAWIFSQYPDCPFDRVAEFPELDAIASAFSDRFGRIWVAEVDERVVGSFAVAQTGDQTVFELFKVYLLPEARGRGVARTMLDMALSHAGRCGAESVRLWSDTRFVEGHVFYRKNGFRQLPVHRYLADLGRTWEIGFTKSLVDDKMGEGNR